MEILKRDEAIPASYPAVPSGLSVAAAALDGDMIWQRIEAYTAHRFTDRQVIWIVEGEGTWAPDLTPVTVTATQVWENFGWATTTLNPSAIGGYELPGDGPYRITANVGGGAVPAAVNEAFRRLAEYMAEEVEHHATYRISVTIGQITESLTRSPEWVARAMQLSGAGDLLRPYRRA